MAQAIFINNNCSANFIPFYPLVHPPLCLLCTVKIFLCKSWRVLFPLTIKTEWQHAAQQWWQWWQRCNPKVKPTHLQYDCMSFTEHNNYPMICLDLVQYVVCMMSTRAQYNKLQGLYQKIALTFWIPFTAI